MTRAKAAASDGDSAGGASWDARARTWAALAFSLAAVLGAAYWFFIVQVNERRRALEMHYAQGVAHLARQAERKIEAYRHIADSALGFMEAGDSATDKDLSQKIGESALPSYKTFLAECKEEAAAGAAPVLDCFARKIASNAAQSALGDSFDLDVCPPATEPEPPAAAAKAGSGAQRAALATSPRPARPGPGSIVFDGERTFYLYPERGPLCGKLSLGSLFRGTPGSAAKTELDGLLVIDDQGRAVWQDPSGKLRVERLPKLSAKDEAAPQPAYSAMFKDVPLGTGAYRVFVEPLTIRRAGSGDPRLTLCRLLSEATLAKQSQQIDPVSFLWAGLLLMLGVLSFPLAKLWLLAPRSRFRRSDVRLLVVSGTLATLVGVTVFMGLAARNRLNADLDARLLERAELVTQRLQARITEAGWALDALAQRFDFAHFSRKETCTGAASCAARETCEAHGCQLATRAPFKKDAPRLSICECTGYQRDHLFLHERSGGAFQRAFWTDLEGRQRLKLAPGPHATPPLDLASRGYVRRAKQLGQAWLAQAPSGGRPPTAVEIVRSKTSGSMVLIAARATIHTRSAGTPGADPAREIGGVLGVETSLKGFETPFLPLDFALAVVDETGKIVLHSDNDAHEGQNILDEISELEDVSSLARLGRAHVDYLGTPSRLHAEPIDDHLWVLMIAPQARVDRPAQSMALATLCLCAMLLLAGALLWLLLRFVCLGLHARDDHHGWLWQLFALTSFRPQPRLTATYVYLGIASFTGAALTYVIVLWLRPTPILCASFAIVGTYTIYQLLRPLEIRMSLARAYALYCFGASSLFLVLPAVAAFAGSYQHFIASMARREASHLLRALERRPGCLDGTCEDLFALSLHAPGPSPRASGDVQTHRGSLASDLHLPALLGTWVETPIHHVLRQFPDLSQPWPRVPDGFSLAEDEYALTLRAADARPSALVHRMELPRLFSPDYHFLRLTFLAGPFAAIALAAFILWTRSVRRLFFLDALAAPAVAPTSAAQLKARLEGDASGAGDARRTRSLLYLYPHPKLVAEIEGDGAFTRWPACTSPEEAARAAHGGREDGATILVVEELSRHLSNETVLSGLEHAVCRGAKVALFSRLDPLLAPLGDLRARWLALLSRVACVAGTHYDQPYPHSPAAIASAWDECDPDEKRVLAQLAFDGHASPNPQNLPVIRKLVTRGLLDAHTFELTHRELRAYVRSVSSTAALRAQEALDGGSPWNMLKVPIATGVLVLLAGVSHGEPDPVTSGLALPGLVVSVPLMLRALISVASARLAGAQGGGAG